MNQTNETPNQLQSISKNSDNDGVNFILWIHRHHPKNKYPSHQNTRIRCLARTVGKQ